MLKMEITRKVQRNAASQEEH